MGGELLLLQREERRFLGTTGEQPLRVLLLFADCKLAYVLLGREKRGSGRDKTINSTKELF